MRTIGVTEGASEPDLAIWPRLSMYCRLSRSARMSHGLCSISYTMPSYLAADIAIAVSGSAWQNDVNAGLPASRERITPFRRGMSAMLFPCAGVFASHPNSRQSRFDNDEGRFVAFGRRGPAFRSRVHGHAAHTPKSDGVMIIDCHGHYTTEPKDLLRWRKEQVENVKEPAKQPSKASLKVSDD